LAKNDFVSLALVYHEPLHAYAINAIIKEMGLEYWAYISPASIYNTLSRLAKIGCVDVTTERVGKMPERKVYQITNKGKKRLLGEIKEALLSSGLGDNPFYLAVMFAYGISANEAISILHERIENLRKVLEHVSQEYEQQKKMNGYNGMIITKAGIKHAQVEIEAANEFIELLRIKPDFYMKDMKNMISHLLKNKGAQDPGVDI
jgi:DNA-binding PadR family transcriptional regulator